MLYTILCYNSEDVVCSWTKTEDDAVMARLATVHEQIATRRKLGPIVRLGFTSTATTLRKDREPAVVTDGPYAETKEALLGFYVVEAESSDEVIEMARELGRANPGGAYEVRPIVLFLPGAALG